MEILILLRHGLANRLRTIVGYLYIAEKLGRKIHFHWDTTDKECNGSWEDLFEPVEFITSCAPVPREFYYFIGQNTVDRIIKGHFPEENRATYSSPWIREIELEYYLRFRIQPDILARVQEVAPQEPFAAVHIRRTDHTVLAKEAGKYTSFEKFNEFIQKHKLVYLATDSRDVQKKYPQLLRNREITKEAALQLRQTSLKDAMVDVLVCAQAEHFMGSGYSSFTHLVGIWLVLLRSTAPAASGGPSASGDLEMD